MDPYDQLHYESIPISETHPRHLAVLGRLFGLDTVDPARCRVLELGCATGGNLIPMAWHYPTAEFLGVDLSPSQIRAGQHLVDTLALNNISLQPRDILRLDETLGSFDYIIAHGVYSWVPPAVREHLLALAGKMLNPAGLLYLSYNTLPGWRMRGTLRDILLRACQGISDTRQQLDAAYATIDRLERALGKLEALSARYLREEIRILRNAHPSYLLFEHLAEENTPFLFSDFVADASRHGLHYLCDTELATLFPATYGEETDQALADIGNDLELEQWLDFVSNRNLRRSVLCRADANPSDELSLDAFAEMALSCDLSPPAKVDLRRIKPEPFHQADGTAVEVQHPLTKAMLLEMLTQQPDFLSLPTLLAGAQMRFQRVEETHAQDYESCLMELFSLFSHRALEASPHPVQFHKIKDARPRPTALAKAQLAAGHSTIATAHHASLDIDSFTAHLIHHLDGRHNLSELAQSLARDMQSGRLTPPDSIKPKGKSAQIRPEQVERSIASLLDTLRRQGLLSPSS